MQKRTKESRKRLNSLILLIAFTAILLIISTYAWFTTQKNVQVSNLKGLVKIAEGLEISLDAKNWTQEIDLSKASLIATSPDGAKRDGSAGDENSDTLPATGTTWQNYAYKDHNNVVPGELLPISTVGETSGVTGTDEAPTSAETVVFARGETNRDKKNGSRMGLKKMEVMNSYMDELSDGSEPGIYAFDIFLKNSTRKADDALTTLQINELSKVVALPNGEDPYVGKTFDDEGNLVSNYDPNYYVAGSDDPDIATKTEYIDRGIQNCVRVGFALYENTVDIREATPEKVLADTKNGKIKDIAIWEPNADAHVSTITFNYGLDNPTAIDKITGLKLKSQKTAAVPGEPTPADATATPPVAAAGINEVWELTDIPEAQNGAFNGTDMFFTYGVKAKTFLDTAATVAADGMAPAYTDEVNKLRISDIYDWSGTKTEGDKAPGNKLAKQNTLQTPVDIEGFGIRNLVSVNQNEDGSDKEFQIGNNKVSKLRVYVWLEGQDPDTINYASYGGGIQVDIGIMKEGNVTGGVND